MKRIIHLSLESASLNSTREIEILGETFQITRMGTDQNLELLIELIHEYDGRVDAFAISGFPTTINVAGKEFVHDHLKKVHSASKTTPIVDGQHLRDLFLNWSIRSQMRAEGQFLRGRKLGFFCGTIQKNILTSLEEAGAKLLFADPYYLAGVPTLLRGEKQLTTFLKSTLSLTKFQPVKQFSKRVFKERHLSLNPFMKEFLKCDAYVCHSSQLSYFTADFLEGRTMIMDTVTQSQKEELILSGIQKVVTFSPEFIDPRLELSFTQIEACLHALKEEPSPLSWNEILSWIQKTGTRPVSISVPAAASNVSKFAFLCHPLSADHVSRALRMKKNPIFPLMEQMTPYVPGFFYGKISGIKSTSTGKEVEGLLYITLETPKMLMKADPDTFYKKAIRITEKAYADGATVMGLGAYTKIVGDGGVSISKGSAIPVTTGNSLSSAATLWAANFGVKQMGFVPETDRIFDGIAMVVGATGSIGKVTTKLLASRWKKVVLCAPNPQKLLELKEEIENEARNSDIHRAELILSTDPSDYLPASDLIITTTSNQKGSVIDMELVRAGAVICDVSRPFDITEEQVQSRPDVLFIASGEVELPGRVKITRDIGLHGSVVYACLAETALLALEGRNESFSLGRNLDVKKVREIDQIARKHGVRLAAIMGHTSEITPEEIELCRRLAEDIREKSNPEFLAGLTTHRKPLKKSRDQYEA